MNKFEVITDYVIDVLNPAALLLPPSFDSASARVMLIAIGLQESGLAERKQINGPARGLHQFEINGVLGLMRHRASKSYVEGLCASRGVPYDLKEIHKALATDDILDACLARLLLRTDPAPLPTTEAAAWGCYLRLWRPGKPHASRWPKNYTLAKSLA